MSNTLHVRVTVGRMLDTGDAVRGDPYYSQQLSRVLMAQDWPPFETLAYACLECGSVGEVNGNRVARDTLVDNYDFTCHVGQTVIFRTEEA